MLPQSQHPILQATSFTTLSPCSTTAASGPSPRSVPLPVGLRSVLPDASRAARSFTVSAPRSSDHLFRRTLSLQHRRSLRVVFQEPAVTKWPLICTAGHRLRGLHHHRLSTPVFRSAAGLVFPPGRTPN
ncbi:hypothetical protein NDU88_002693 [Pleurodeles waltl]|uniref:Uncharacterized protein n=1 Tax=Pleurodeles waltl TaxID=8319 RepID=A0AAV7SCF5_PLEWA|nr:hypothetical protein NDU88_002693 [Pleurodeles waltl]